MRRTARRRWLVGTALGLAGCGALNGSGTGCGVVEGPRPLPDPLSEASGAAVSMRSRDLYWTHSDNAGPGVIWGVHGDGSVAGQVQLEGVKVYDAEDITTASCAAGACVYLADAGDNYDERDTVYVYRLPEPDPTVPMVRADRFPILLPDGPRDIEAVFVLPGEHLFLVTKGREKPISVYRYPGPLRPDTAVRMEEVQKLSQTPRVLPRQVTGASAAVDGSIVALRTYETLMFYRWDGAQLVPVTNGTVSLRSLREAQGEGIGLGPDGLVVLTSEGGPARAAGSITLLRCRFTEPR